MNDETKQPTPEETLQSMDSTLKRIEAILRDKKEPISLQGLKDAFASQIHQPRPEYRFEVTIPPLFEQKREKYGHTVRTYSV